MSATPGRGDADLTQVRLLMVIDRVEDVGGAEGSTTLILRGLHEHGVRLGVVGLDGVTITDRSQLTSEGVCFFEPSGRGFVSSVRCVLRAIREVRPALIHATLARSEMTARVAGFIAGVPVMTSIVNTQYGEQARALSPSRVKLNTYRLIDGFLARHATFAFHAISAASADAASEALSISRKRIDVVTRGRNDEHLGRRSPERFARMRDELGIPIEDQVMVNIAREDLQKGQTYLIEALVALNCERVTRVHLVIAGRRGSASSQIDAAVAAHRLSDVVHRLGVRTDVPDVLCAADIFAFPSLHEGLGGALLEALALEVPIVAFDDPAVREAVGDAGVLVPLRDGLAFTAALGALLADPVRQADLARRGRARFEQHFTNDRYIASMLDLYVAVWSSIGTGYRDPLRLVRRRGHTAW